MALLVQMLRKQFLLTLAAVCASGLATTVTLWWNAQLSSIINTVSTGNPLPMDIIVLAIGTILGMGVIVYIKDYISGFACESLTHDLRMGYARYFSTLSIPEIERLNAGEQLSKLQNEIADISGYLNNNLFQIFDDSVRFIATFAWLLILNMKLTLTVNLPVLVILIYVLYSSKIIANATERSQQAKG